MLLILQLNKDLMQGECSDTGCDEGDVEWDWVGAQHTVLLQVVNLNGVINQFH